VFPGPDAIIEHPRRKGKKRQTTRLIRPLNLLRAEWAMTI
jgi:hypothetical protein